MPNLYARQVALTNVAGRIDYISNPLKQENLLAVYDTAADLLDGQFWSILAKECQDAFVQSGVTTRMFRNRETGEMEARPLKCVEGREFHFQIGNELLDRLSPDEILKEAADTISAYIGQPVIAALHFNKKRSGLHIHVILPERTLLPEPVIKVAERNLFFDAEGKRRYKKSEILDENKQLLPGCRIVKKGEVYETRYFGSVDPKFSQKQWLRDLKRECLLRLRNGALKGNVEITEFDYSTGKLPQLHIGNRRTDESKERAEKYNRLVREYNALIDEGLVPLEEAIKAQQDVLAAEDRVDTITWYIKQLRVFLEEDRGKPVAPRNNSLASLIQRAGGWKAGPYWQQYRTIRDDTWKIFIQGQRTEIGAIRACRIQRQELDARNSHAVIEHGEIRYQKNSRSALQRAGYFEDRKAIGTQEKQHRIQLETLRKYQGVAKGRQKILRALMMAGAEKSVIDAAMDEYQKAMQQLQNYTNNPEGDYEGRRLKAAEWSLGQAQNRAERYIQSLTEERLKEESDLEIIAEREYQVFMANKNGSGGGPEEERETPIVEPMEVTGGGRGSTEGR